MSYLYSSDLVRTGDGETAAGLHSLFRTAWEASPNSPVPIFGSGSNILPTMHCADFAAYVTAVCASPPAQQYLLAADNSRLTQHEIVTAVAAKMGNSNIKELELQDFMFQQAGPNIHCMRWFFVCKQSLCLLPSTRPRLQCSVICNTCASATQLVGTSFWLYLCTHPLLELCRIPAAYQAAQHFYNATTS